MTNLDRWKPLARNVMDLLALGDDPQRLYVIQTALAGAAQAVRDELGSGHLSGLKAAGGEPSHDSPHFARARIAEMREALEMNGDWEQREARLWAMLVAMEAALSDD